MGLIRAAQRFDAASGVPFAAFALPRIHTAVNDALRGQASMIRTPRARRRRGLPSESAGGRTGPDHDRHARGEWSQPWPSVKVTHLEEVARLPDRHSGAIPGLTLHASVAGGCRTLGDRVREKYEQALRRASADVLRRRSQRADRAALVHKIIEERMRVPDPEQQTALRQLARATGSSYSRVLQCEKQLRCRVRRVLATDLEFKAMLEMAREETEGLAAPLDTDIARRLRWAAADAFCCRLRTARSPLRAVLVWRLLEALGPDAEAAVHRLFRGLAEPAADALLEEASADATARGA
jgi:hypothetical protein